MHLARLRRDEVKSASLTPAPRQFKISDLKVAKPSNGLPRDLSSEYHHEEK